MATPVTGVRFHSSVLQSSALKCPVQSFFKDKRAVNSSSISPLPADYLGRHKILMLPCISRSALPSSRAPRSNQDIVPIHRFPSIMEARPVTTSPQSATSPRELQTDRLCASLMSADLNVQVLKWNGETRACTCACMPCALNSIHCHSALSVCVHWWEEPTAVEIRVESQGLEKNGGRNERKEITFIFFFSF